MRSIGDRRQRGEARCQAPRARHDRRDTPWGWLGPGARNRTRCGAPAPAGVGRVRHAPGAPPHPAQSTRASGVRLPGRVTLDGARGAPRGVGDAWETAGGGAGVALGALLALLTGCQSPPGAADDVRPGGTGTPTPAARPSGTGRCSWGRTSAVRSAGPASPRCPAPANGRRRGSSPGTTAGCAAARRAHRPPTSCCTSANGARPPTRTATAPSRPATPVCATSSRRTPATPAAGAAPHHRRRLRLRGRGRQGPGDGLRRHGAAHTAVQGDGGGRRAGAVPVVDRSVRPAGR